jgi:hypothetical protein
MRLPDGLVVAFPGGEALPPRTGRDPRIDAFRGLALIMIFINHVPGNPYEFLTNRNYGFSDAAEAFFVMSGIAAGIAYSGGFTAPALLRDGLWAAIQPIWKRAWTLYVVQILLTVWAIAIFALGAVAFDLPELLTQINLRQVFAHPEAALAGIPALTHQLGYVNILPAYTVLLLLTPPALLLGQRFPVLLAVLSAALWLATGAFVLNLPNYPNPGGWFFNPLAWQAVFVCGLLIGMQLRKGRRLVPVSRPLFWAAAGYLVFVLAWMKIGPLADWLNGYLSAWRDAGVPLNLVSHDKTFLALPRLLHVLALVYVVSCLPAMHRAAGSRFAAPLRLMGRHGLLVFAIGTVVALAFQVLFAAMPDSVWLHRLLPPVGLLLLLGAAFLGEGTRPRKQGVAAPTRSAETREAMPAFHPAE